MAIVVLVPLTVVRFKGPAGPRLLRSFEPDRIADLEADKTSILPKWRAGRPRLVGRALHRGPEHEAVAYH